MEKTVRIGSKNADILVDNPKVSETHGEFKLIDNHIFYRDLGSKYGSFIIRDGIQYKVEGIQQVEVLEGDSIFIVDVVMGRRDIMEKIKNC